MLKFILKDEPVIKGTLEHWYIIQVYPQPSKIIAVFVGGDDEKYLDKDIAPLVAGDYVEFLNEKYLDKEINAEWPPQDPLIYLDYHLKKALQYSNELQRG